MASPSLCARFTRVSLGFTDGSSALDIRTCSNLLLRYRRDLLGEEAFSSWFGDIAVGNKHTPRELLLFLQHSTATTGLDLTSPQAPLIRHLSHLTQVPADKLAESLLTTYGCLFDSDFREELRTRRWPRRWPWVLNTQQDSKANFPCGTQFCPSCLSHNKVYFRKHWRLALFCCCPDLHHETMLLDRCSCQEPVRPFASLKIESIADAIRLRSGSLCPKCHSSLAQLPTIPAPPGLLRKERLQLRIIRGGPAIRAEAGLYFLGMRSLLRLLLVRDRQGDRFRASVSQLSGFSCEHLQNKGSVWFETMDVNDRALALQAVNWLFTNWPDNFIAATRNALFKYPPNVSSVGGSRIAWLHSALHHAIHPHCFPSEKRDARKSFFGSNRKWWPFAKAITSE